MGEDQAQNLGEFIETKVKGEFNSRKDVFATKQDVFDLRADLLRTIYIVGIVQLVGIVGSVLAIVKFIH